MSISLLLDSNVYTWVIIPILIFLARIIDVTIGTIRVIFISKGYKFLAPILGFFEILVWLSAIRQILMNLSNIACFIAYAAGFSVGTFVGIQIEEKLSIGKVLVRIITRKNSNALIEKLKSLKQIVTTIDGEGPEGNVKIIFTVIKKLDMKKIKGVIKKFNPQAFYSIEDIRFTSGRSFSENKININKLRVFGYLRKGK
ncbi:MAG: DUF2179 domain-containing protein [Nanoarchaeota archaeon]|nr:DUF2179 domain-containing protein [Nanoarchaeota archaeon]MBU1029735.1 DUF2179 domain-containing protein [Nanoarchaeota archaeon]MBU1849166.1 DUF2179 domain-containing protein [Nanoarchaeota archaeon]